MENEMIQKAKKELDYLSSDYETVRLAELREKAIMDYNSGIEGAREEGIQRGREQGIQRGMEQGIQQSKRDDILENLALLGDVPIDIAEKINKEENVTVLKKWLRLSFEVKSIDEFRAGAFD